MLRTTLKQQRHQSARQTRRAHRLGPGDAGAVQRGGAKWKSIEDPTRKAIWDEVLPAELKFVTSDWATEDDSVQKYITIVANQDALFNAAVKCMYKSIGVADPATEEDILDKYKVVPAGEKEGLFEYLHDVEELINFRRADEPGSAATRTKIQQIEKEDLLQLLLNPTRAENSFMKELASVCITQKGDPTILEKAASDPNIKSVRYLKYLTTAEGNTLLQTGAHLRDGFHVAHKMNEFSNALGINVTEKSGTFWDIFVTGCIDPNIGKFKEPDVRKTFYSVIAAKIYSVYATTDAAGLLSAVLRTIPLKDNPASSTTLTGYIASSSSPDSRFPDAAELDKIVIEGLTLKQLIASIDLAQLQFIVHLCKTIELNEAAVLAALPKKP